MGLHTFARQESLKPGNSATLKMEAGLSYAMLVDADRDVRGGRFDSTAVGVEVYQPATDDRSAYWYAATIYLRSRELQALASVCSLHARTLVQAWVELTPVVNAMTGEVRTREDGTEITRKNICFALEAHEGQAGWDDWQTPERIEPTAQRAVYARPTTQGPPPPVKPAPAK